MRKRDRHTAAVTPKISLCVPTYNRAALLRHCVSTLLNQTAANFEIVVVDNCSSDDTSVVVAEFSADPRFRYHRNTTNIGPQRNWNKCVDVARGEYVAICHDDDFYAPTFAEECGAFLDAHPSVGFVHCGYHIANQEGEPIGAFRAYRTDQVLPSKGAFLQFLAESHNVAFSCVMARRGAYAAAGPFRDGLICGDYDMWLRMAFHFDVGYRARLLVYSRTHAGRLSHEVPLRRWYEEHVRIIDDAVAMAGTSMPEMLARRDELVNRARALWARRGLREALSLGAGGALVDARAYCEMAASLAVSPGLRLRARLARLLLSPLGAPALQVARQTRRRLRGQEREAALAAADR